MKVKQLLFYRFLFISIAFLILRVGNLQSQNAIYFYNQGNPGSTYSNKVGINTSTPTEELHVKSKAGIGNTKIQAVFENNSGTGSIAGIQLKNSNNNWNILNDAGRFALQDSAGINQFVINKNGNLSLGSNVISTAKLFVNGRVLINSNLTVDSTLKIKRNINSLIYFSNDLNNVAIGIEANPNYKLLVSGGITKIDSDFFVGSGIKISKSGWIGIGAEVPDNNEKLSVNGTIKAEELIIDSVAGADFVFENNYKRPTLQEVEQYINENKHLPDIASASEMQANGVSVGDLNMQLLQKVEELTLYIIDINKENQRLAVENNQIIKQNEEIRKQLEVLISK